MHVIGLDLGGTKTAGAILDSTGRILDKNLKYLENKKGSEAGRLIQDQLRELLSSAREKNIKILSAGISVPGIYFSKSGRVWAPNIPGWEDYPLLDELSALPETENISIKIDSDRACYILGETWLGNARGSKDAIFMAVGTGIGAGILINGRILRGHRDIAGAIGWTALDRPFKDEYTACGCFEHHASGDGIAKTARDFLKRDEKYRGPLKAKKIQDIKSYDVFDAYQNGDPLAKKIFEHCISFWGMAAANLVSLFNPEKIIFGGGVFGPAARFLDQIYSEAKKWAQPVSIQQVKFEVSALGDDAGLIGAGRLAFLDK